VAYEFTPNFLHFVERIELAPVALLRATDLKQRFVRDLLSFLRAFGVNSKPLQGFGD